MSYTSDILPEEFLSQYKDKKPNWGYNGLGEIVYKRTYSRLKEDGTNEEWWPVLENGISIGKVTTAAYSPRLKKNIGFAMLPIEKSAVGTKLTIVQRGLDTEAIVVKQPFAKDLSRQRS